MLDMVDTMQNALKPTSKIIYHPSGRFDADPYIWTPQNPAERGNIPCKGEG